MRKGQIFFIIAIVVITLLILLKISLSLTSILENKRFLESGLEIMEFQNVKGETIRTIGISYNLTQNITQNILDFTKFSRGYFDSRTMSYQGILVLSQFPTVSSGANTNMNVTVFNALGTNLQNLNVSFSYDGSSNNVTGVGDLSTISKTFVFNTASTVNYSLIVFYKTAELNSTENITIPVEIGKSKYIGFFDLKLTSDRLSQRDKFARAITLS